MNKEDYSKFSMFAGLDNDPCYIPVPAPVKGDTDFDKILECVFSVDPRTGFPMSDLAYYLSPNGDPSVREWLINNLLKPRAAASGNTIDGAYDDLIHEMSRGITESLDDYRERIYNIGQDARAFIESHKDDEK